MNLCVGHRLKVWRADKGASLDAVGQATRIPKWKLSAFELGGRLTTDEVATLEETLEAIEKIQSAIFPARLDCRDGIALKAAVDAFHQGRFGDIERMAVQPPENPSVIGF